MEKRTCDYRVLLPGGRAFEVEGIKPIKFPEGLKLSPIEMGHMEEVVDMSAFLDDDEDE